LGYSGSIARNNLEHITVENIINSMAPLPGIELEAAACKAVTAMDIIK
jgi:hypothetical protein